MLFKPNASKQTFFHSICPDDRLKCIKQRHLLYQKIKVLLVSHVMTPLMSVNGETCLKLSNGVVTASTSRG